MHMYSIYHSSSPSCSTIPSDLRMQRLRLRTSPNVSSTHRSFAYWGVQVAVEQRRAPVGYEYTNVCCERCMGLHYALAVFSLCGFSP
jgi:hypothetical protein